MKTLTGHLPEKYRSVVRFVCVGIFGTGFQYGIYYLFLYLFEQYCPDLYIKVSLAFTIGFLVEMISNYILTSYYTFHSHPNIKNASGFIFGRGLNYLLQIGFLHFLMWASLSEELAGILAIVLAGIINYFVLLFFYRNKNTQQKDFK